MNLSEKTTTYFQKHPDLRVLFFFDPERESEEEVKQLTPNDYKVVFYNNNSFSLKLKFHDDWVNERIFLYLPVKRPETQEGYLNFPLLDLLVANRELRLDDVGEFMDEFKLKANQRSLVSKYIGELKNASVQRVAVNVLKPGNFEERSLRHALISAFLNFTKVVNKELLIAKMLTLPLKKESTELNRFRNKITGNHLMETLDIWVLEFFGEKLEQITEERLLHLIAKLKYNLICAGTEPRENDPYGPLKLQDPYRLNNLITLKEQAMYHPGLRDKFSETLEQLGQQVREQKLVEIYGVHGEYSWLNKAMVKEFQAAAVTKLVDDPLAEIPLLEQIYARQELDGDLLHVNNYLFHTAQALQKIRKFSNLLLDRPADYVERYTSEWYKIDTDYRKAVLAYSKADVSTDGHAGLYKDARDSLEKAYTDFLNKSNREWLRCLAGKNFDYSELSVPLQYNFYEEEIAPLDQKVAVIISDALRYEVAAELLLEIHKDSRSEVYLNHRLASIPSTTAVGMTNLLPGKEMVMEDSRILVDNISVANREQLLQKANPASKVISYTELKEFSEKENREIFKSQVVYVYHDVIDAIGHKRASEKQTFDVVASTALPDLAKLVKYIHSTLGVAKVIITADHGFVYNDYGIEEKEFDPPISEDINLDTHKNRYGLLKEKKEPESGYCIPFSAANKIKSDGYVIIPDGVNRYHRKGAGTRFVHGGGSLQELVVPVIESRRRSVKSIRKVMPVLLNQKLVVVSNTLKLQILQENPVSNTEKERTLMVGLYDGNDLVSNLEEINMREVSDQPSQRIFSVNLVLLPGQAKKSRFSLRVFDIEDELNRLIEKDVENSTLYGTDF